MPKQTFYQKLITLIKYLTKLLDSVSEFASKLKWIGIAVTVILGFSHYETCKDKDDYAQKYKKASSEKDSCIKVEKMMRKIGARKTDSILKHSGD